MMRKTALPQLPRRKWSRLWRCTLVPFIAWSLLSPLLIGCAAADEYDAVTVVLGNSTTWDANLFRLPSDFAPPAGFSSKSDRINATYVGLRIDKPYDQQRFQLSATETSTRYNNFTFLNFDATEYRAAWLWQLGPRFSGTISEERKQALIPFVDFRGFERNVRTTTNRIFNVNAWMIQNWHLLGGISQYESRNAQPFLAETSYRSNSAELGAQYAAPSGNSLTLTQRETRGDYLNQAPNPVTFTDNGFKQRETELKATWIPTGLSRINGRLSWLDRRHEHFSQRDFSGLGGQVDYTWTPAGKVQLALTARRDVGAWWDLGSFTANSSYKVTDTLTFSPIWQVDTRTAIRASFNRILIDYRGPVVPDPRPVRNDAIRAAQLAVDWSPFRFASITASIERDWRNSNNPSFPFGDTIASLSVSLMF